MWCCFASARACRHACPAYECLDMQMHVSKKSWCTFRCICVGVSIYVLACKGRGADLAHQGTGVPGNAIHFHQDVTLNEYQCV